MAKDASLDAAIIEFCEVHGFKISEEVPWVISKNNVDVCVIDSDRWVNPCSVKNQDEVEDYFGLMSVLKKNKYLIQTGTI